MEELAATGEDAALAALEKRMNRTIKQERPDEEMTGDHHQMLHRQLPTNPASAAAYMFPDIKPTPHSAPNVRRCQVCQEPASGNFFGALVCLPCKTFFIRCTTEDITTFKCRRNNDCEITGPNRSRCKYCRYRKCVNVGMIRKERPEHVEAVEGQQLCVVCRDIANGIHFGVVSCEGCKKFFRRGLQESDTYVCKYSQTCVINPKTRNDCRFCRFSKCLRAGMSRDAIKMGRPRKNMKELGMFEQHANAFFNPMLKYVTQHVMDPVHSKQPLYHPYNNSRGMSMFYHMQQQQQRQMPAALSAADERLPMSSPSSNYLPQRSFQQQAEHPASRSSYQGTHTQQNHHHHHHNHNQQPPHQLRWQERHVSTPGSLSSECSESSENDLSSEERTSQSPLNFSLRRGHSSIPEQSQHPLYALENKYGPNSSIPVMSSTCHLGPHYFKSEPESHHATSPHPTSRSQPEKLPTNSSCPLSPPPTPPSPVHVYPPLFTHDSPSTVISAALDLSQDSSISAASSSDPQGDHQETSSQSTVHRNLEQQKAPEQEEDGFPSKHEQFIMHKFNPSYWSHALSKTPRAALNDDHRTKLNAMVTGYLSFVEDFCKDDKLRDLRSLWKSSDVSEQTLVFQKQVIHQLATVISFVHIIPGFSQVNSEDKYTILRLGTIQLSTVVAAINLYNPLTHTFVKTFFEEGLNKESPMHEFRCALLALARAVHQLNLDSVEAACLLTILAVASDWPSLQCPDKLEEVRLALLEAFESYVLDKYGKSSTRLETILAIIPRLRDLGMWHYKITFQLSFME